MEENIPMSVLVIEDDVGDAVKFRDCANFRKDIKIVGITGYCEDGLMLVQSHLPEAVILDLQLAGGSGSGIKFMEMLNQANLLFRPIIMVTTSNQSAIIYSRMEELGVDWIFSKKQSDYSAGFVFDTLLSLRKHAEKRRSPNRFSERVMIETPEERRKRINIRINAELDFIGIKAKYKGRIYLYDGINIVIHDEKGSGSVIDKIAAKYKHSYNTICTGMQTAINNAWASVAPEELDKIYTARISAASGIPTPTEFIHYYANKIRDSI
jgi:CheY-like chemotaxis protein